MNKYLILCALSLSWACGSHTHSSSETDPHAGHNHAAEASTEEAHGAENEIVLTPEQLTMLGVSSDTVRRGPFAAVLRTSGVVAPSSGDRAVASASADGLVTFVNPSLAVGSTVAKGQRLFTVSNRSLPDGDRAARAKADLSKAEAAYRRARELAAERVVSQKELEAAEQEYTHARLTYDAAQTSTTVVAPIAGVVTSLDVANGAFASVGTPLATIAQNRKLTLTVDVPSNRIEGIGRYRAARFRHAPGAPYFTTSARTGTNASIGAGNAYGSVTFEVDNRAGIVPGAFVEVLLLGDERAGVLSVPASALLEQEGLYSVVVRLDEECFEVRPVTIGASDGQQVEITDGLAAGEQVVVAGAYRVKMAGASSAIPEGHTH